MSDKIKKGDRAYFVDDMGDHITIRVRQVVQAGARRVVTEGPGGRRTHQIIGDGPRYLPALHLTPAAALEEYIGAKERNIATHERQLVLRHRERAEARALLVDYQAGRAGKVWS